VELSGQTAQNNELIQRQNAHVETGDNDEPDESLPFTIDPSDTIGTSEKLKSFASKPEMMKVSQETSRALPWIAGALGLAASILFVSKFQVRVHGAFTTCQAATKAGTFNPAAGAASGTLSASTFAVGGLVGVG